MAPSNKKTLIEDYKRDNKYKTIFLLFLFISTVIASLYSIRSGVLKIPLKDIIHIIISSIRSKGSNNIDDVVSNIIINIRLPRVVMGILVGVGLGASGALMQTILMNPMASPYTLGISSGAGLGASLAIIYGFSPFGLTGELLTISNAFLFAMAASILILVIARIRNNSHQDLILAGIALMNFFNAIVTLITYFADVYSSKELMYWQVGSLGKADWISISYVGVILLLTLPYIISKTSDLNKMALGDEVAESLGTDAKKLRIKLMLVLSLLVGGITAFTGMIGFIGLVVPHLIRLILGSNNKFLIAGSALGGALLLILADSIALNIIAPKVLPVGVLTAFIGSPVFLIMIFKNRRRI